MIRKAMLTAATATVTLSLLLTACGTTPASVPTPGPAAPATDDALTRAAFNLTWADVSNTERTALCDGLTVLGPDGAATAMGKGQANTNNLDWPLMVELLTAECDNR
ncbi:hypothetical protein ABT185_07640 [Streptomyces clavifer]|uniref:hypothetical protein n=1 Tax=Streptomyces clavifer TaxID=68188 RepID=UPI0033333168